MVDKLSWHAQLHSQAYSDFSVPEPAPFDRLAYCVTVAGQIVYRSCLVIFWITLNCCTIAFGVFVEPLWRKNATFRRLQLPGKIPVIAIALPILLAYAAWRTFQMYGIWHVILPFAFIAVSGAVLLGSLAGFNIVRRATFIRVDGKDRT